MELDTMSRRAPLQQVALSNGHCGAALSTPKCSSLPTSISSTKESSIPSSTQSLSTLSSTATTTSSILSSTLVTDKNCVASVERKSDFRQESQDRISTPSPSILVVDVESMTTKSAQVATNHTHFHHQSVQLNANEHIEPNYSSSSTISSSTCSMQVCIEHPSSDRSCSSSTSATDESPAPASTSTCSSRRSSTTCAESSLALAVEEEDEEDDDEEEEEEDEQEQEEGEEEEGQQQQQNNENNDDQQPDCDAIKLFVGQIPREWDEAECERLLRPFGRIHTLRLLRDRGGQSRGCLFVTYFRRKCALAAQDALHNVRRLPGMAHPLQLKPANALSSNQRKLFVGMLGSTINEIQVRQMFNSFGMIEECSVLRDTDGHSRGCAFVTFANRQSALNAIKRMHHSETMDGCNSPLVVKFADTQKDKQQRLAQQLLLQQLAALNLQPNSIASAASLVPPLSPHTCSGALINALLPGVAAAAAAAAVASPETRHQSPNLCNNQNRLAGNRHSGRATLHSNGSTDCHGSASSATRSNSGHHHHHHHNNSNNMSMAAAAAATLAAATQHPFFSLALSAAAAANAVAANPFQTGSNSLTLGSSSVLPSLPPPPPPPPPTANNHNSIGSGHLTDHALAYGNLFNYAALAAHHHHHQPHNHLHGSHITGGGVTKHHHTMDSGGSPPLASSDHSLRPNLAARHSFRCPAVASLQSMHPQSIASLESQERMQVEGPNGSNLFIYHLPAQFGDAELLATFAPFGCVLSARVFVDRRTRLSKCFGFVSYDNPLSAAHAIRALNGLSLGAKRLKVQLKRSSQHRTT